MENVYIIYGHLEYFRDKREILCPSGTFGTFYPILVSRNKKNLATLEQNARESVKASYFSTVTTADRVTWRHSNDRELQRQRRKNLRRCQWPT
jgi:hypothetical protein